MSETSLDRSDSSDTKTETKPGLPRLFRWLVTVLVLSPLIPAVYVFYRHRQQMHWIRDIEARGGGVATRPIGANWLRHSIGPRQMLGFDDVWGVELVAATDEDLHWMSNRQNMRRLSNLTLKEPDLTEEGIATIAEFGHLRFLRIGGDNTLLQKREQLTQLVNLETLVLSETSLTEQELDNLDVIPSLRYLGLHDVKLSDQHLKVLSQYTHLRGLSLSGCPVARHELQMLEPLSELTSLELSGTGLADDDLVSLAPFQQLESLRISSSLVSDSGVESLAQLKQLKRLNIERTAVSRRGARALKAALPDCEIAFDMFDMFDP